MRWRDLYLSGSTLYIGETVLKRDDETGGVSILNRTASNVNGEEGNNTFVPAMLKVSKMMSDAAHNSIDVSGSTLSNVNIHASRITATGAFAIDAELVETPEVALAGNSSGGFQALASSVSPASSAYQAFDKSVGTAWTSAAETYLSISGLVNEQAETLSVVQTITAGVAGTASGQYVELRLPAPIALRSYKLTAPALNGPRAFLLLGNTVGSAAAWKVLDSVADASWTVSSELTRTITTVQPAYNAYRLLATATQIFATTASVKELALFSSGKVLFDNAYVGIGTTAPAYPLHVEGAVQAQTFIGSGAGLTSLPTSQLSGAVLVANGGTGASSLTADKLVVGNGSSTLLSPANLHWDSTSNHLGIGTTEPAYPLHVEGKMFATDGMVAFSDARLKTNVIEIEGALDIIAHMRGVRYDRIDLPASGRHVGLIAQEVEAVMPEVVSTDAAGMKSLAYANLVAVLIQAVKEQQVQIDGLKARLA